MIWMSSQAGNRSRGRATWTRAINDLHLYSHRGHRTVRRHCSWYCRDESQLRYLHNCRPPRKTWCIVWTLDQGYVQVRRLRRMISYGIRTFRGITSHSLQTLQHGRCYKLPTISQVRTNTRKQQVASLLSQANCSNNSPTWTEAQHVKRKHIIMSELASSNTESDQRLVHRLLITQLN